MKKTLVLAILMLLHLFICYSQGKVQLTLSDAFKLAQEQSLQTFLNKHYYMADYWAYRSFKADMLPSVSLRATPLAYSNASELRFNWENQTDEYTRTENLISNLNLNISQKVAATGGTFFVQSELGRIENYGRNEYTQYSSRPFSIGYQQQLFGFNEMKWQRRIEPLAFEKAKKEYLLSTESMHLSTIRQFFGLGRLRTKLLT